MVEEVAVVPEPRRHGRGAALLGECHRIARDRGVKHVQAPRRSPTAHRDLFRSAGYMVGPRRTNVSKEYQCDLLTFWDPAYNHLGGSHVCNHIDRLS